MAKIRVDSRGVFILANGSCYRPFHPEGYRHIHKDGSVFRAGQKVKAKALSGSPLLRVKLGDVTEYWHSHGSYYENGKANFKATAHLWILTFHKAASLSGD